MTFEPTKERLGIESTYDGMSLFTPTQIREVELSRGLPNIPESGGYQKLLVLGKLLTEPLGTCLVDVPKHGLSADDLAHALWQEFRDPVSERFARAGLAVPDGLTSGGLRVPQDEWPFLRTRTGLLNLAPFISVVVCTRDRSDQLKKCLTSLDQQDYPSFEVVVVDNAPTSDRVARLVKSWNGRIPYGYIVERRPGLSRARNAGVKAASGQVIAFLDDDDQADPHWLAELARGFSRGPNVGCVTGLVLPARLDTLAEQMFEYLGGHSKDRGFVSSIFSESGPQNPLYPLPPFGAGANMAFRREVLDKIGGFDEALGAGTFACAGEDTLAFTMTLLSGYVIAYEPSVLMWHQHRRDLESLSHQLHGYSLGLTAFYMALLRHRPSALLGLIRLIPAAGGYVGASEANRTSMPSGLLKKLDRRHRRGLLVGPMAYLRGALFPPSGVGSKVQGSSSHCGRDSVTGGVND